MKMRTSDTFSLADLGQGVTGSQLKIGRDLEILITDAGTLQLWSTKSAFKDAIWTRPTMIASEARQTLPSPLNEQVYSQLIVGIVQHTKEWLESNSPKDWMKAKESLINRGTAIHDKVLGITEAAPAVYAPAPTALPPEVPTAPKKFVFTPIMIGLFVVVTGGLILYFAKGKLDSLGLGSFRRAKKQRRQRRRSGRFLTR